MSTPALSLIQAETAAGLLLFAYIFWLSGSALVQGAELVGPAQGVTGDQQALDLAQAVTGACQLFLGLIAVSNAFAALCVPTRVFPTANAVCACTAFLVTWLSFTLALVTVGIAAQNGDTAFFSPSDPAQLSSAIATTMGALGFLQRFGYGANRGGGMFFFSFQLWRIAATRAGLGSKLGDAMS